MSYVSITINEIVFMNFRDIALLNLQKVRGFILNVPTDLSLGFIHIPIMRKHWIAVAKVKDNYYNLDSKRSSPKCIGGEQELRDFLKDQISDADKELFVVVDQSIGRDNVWLSSEETIVESSEKETEISGLNS